MVAAAIAAPLLRKRVSAPPLVMQTVAFAGPLGLSVAARRSSRRDVAVCCLQMWAYLAAYKTPHDDEAAQAARVHIDYPIDIDRVLGLGELPTMRLQRAFARTHPETGAPVWRTVDRVLVWAHWVWFIVPHGSLVYILVRHPQRFTRAAVMTYATFDIGASFYWLFPTAPPWYAASLARGDNRGERHVRRLMVEYGEHFWRRRWPRLYSLFGGNPLAAMPSLHFATSSMAAVLLSETGAVPGAVGVAYAGLLGFALVYLGEHYVVDLIGGAALCAAVLAGEPLARAPLGRIAGAIEHARRLALPPPAG